MPKRAYNPAKPVLTEAIEECDLLYGELKWATHTQQMPSVKADHLDLAQAHLDRIQELINNAR